MTEEITRVLCNWQPVGFDFSDETIENQELLSQLLRMRLLSIGYHVTIYGVFYPSHEWKGLFRWHPDGDGAFIVWSNISSSEVRLEDGNILQVQDGDVILIVNDEHRTRSPVPAGRWLVRTNFL